MIIKAETPGTLFPKRKEERFSVAFRPKYQNDRLLTVFFWGHFIFLRAIGHQLAKK